MKSITKQEIEKRVIKVNSSISHEDLNWRADKRLEWICECGVGHTLFSPSDTYIHGCCGCCEDKTTVKHENFVESFNDWISYF